MDDIGSYLSGRVLYGNDFTPAQIRDWFADEREGYAALGAADASSYAYAYHALNTFHAFRYLPRQRFHNVLGFGSAYGDELLPIITNIDGVTIVDPSEAFARDKVHGVPAVYIKPTPDGVLGFPDAHFDLTTCLGVLHHIPNVSFVLNELARTLRAGGFIAIREPIHSMGDWRHPRRGLTKRERGIPLHLIREMLWTCRLRVMRETLCDFPLTGRLFRGLSHAYNSKTAVRLDTLLSTTFAWNVKYHRRSLLDRLGPRSVFILAQKLK